MKKLSLIGLMLALVLGNFYFARAQQGASYPPIMVQATTVSTDASGNWSVTWNNTFQSSTPFVQAFPVNSAGTNPMICNTTAMTANTATGKCWQTTSQNNAILSLNISLAPSSLPASTSVQVIARDRTQ